MPENETVSVSGGGNQETPISTNTSIESATSSNDDENFVVSVLYSEILNNQ